MSTITPEELFKQWKLEQMPVEMAMGHVLQNLVKQQTLLNKLELTFAQFRAQPDSAPTPPSTILLSNIIENHAK